MNKGIGCEPRTVTAAVNVEVLLVDESQSLRNWEGKAETQKTSAVCCQQKVFGGLS